MAVNKKEQEHRGACVVTPSEAERIYRMASIVIERALDDAFRAPLKEWGEIRDGQLQYAFAARLARVVLGAARIGPKLLATQDAHWAEELRALGRVQHR